MPATARVNDVAPERAIGCPTEDNALSLTSLTLVRKAIDDSGEKHMAVAAALGVDPPYLARMLSGEKSFPLQKLDRLPDSVRRIYARLEAEREGWQVVEESDRRSLIRRVIAELLIELTNEDPRLPTRAGRPLKAALR
jgi:hypothetical protein